MWAPFVARKDTPMNNILQTTFGLRWPVIPELVRLSKSRCLDLYARHPHKRQIEALRERSLSSVDDVCIVGTTGIVISLGMMIATGVAH